MKKKPEAVLCLPDYAEIRLPTLTTEDFRAALERAHDNRRKRGHPQEVSAPALKRVNAAFQEYCSQHLLYELSKPLAPSRMERRLRAFANSVARLRASIDDNFIGQLAMQAEQHGEKIGGYKEFPPRQVLAQREDGTLIDRIYYRGHEVVEQALKWLPLLEECGRNAEQKMRQRKGDHAQHKGDPYMRQLIRSLNEVWVGCVGTSPGASIAASGGVPGGPYIRFLGVLFERVSERLSPEAERYAPGLRKALDPTPDALRAYIRSA